MTRLQRATLTIVVAALLLTVTAPAQAAGTTYTPWTWNVAGHTMHRGSTTDGMVAAAASSIVNRGATHAVLNEICRPQYDAIIGRLRAAGWPADPSNFARFRETLDGSTGVCGGNDFGLAMFTRAPITAAAWHLLPDDGTGQAHGMLCLTAGPATVRLCGLHITTAQGVNVEQLDAAHAAANEYVAQGVTPIVSGDYNAAPHYARLAGWQSDYRELDSTDSRCAGYGEWTAVGTPGAPHPCTGSTTCTAGDDTGCAKIDHTFAPDDRIVGDVTADALTIPTTCPTIRGTVSYPAGSCSDHRVYVGTVTVTT